MLIYANSLTGARWCSQVRLDTALIEVLNTLVSRQVSALPVVDDQQRVIDVYAKFDVIVSQNNHVNAIKQYNKLIFFYREKQETQTAGPEKAVLCILKCIWLHFLNEKL